MPCEFLVGFWETRTYLRTRDNYHVSTSRSRCDNRDLKLQESCTVSIEGWRERDSVLYLVSHQRREEVLNHLVLGLVQSVFPSPSDLRSHLSWVHHHLVLLLKVERWQRGAHCADSSIRVIMVRHMCIFIVDRKVMSRDSIHCWMDLV